MQTINDRYTFDPARDELGKGGFGRVFRAKDSLLDRDVVLKFVEKGDIPDKYSLIKEISRVIDLSHPNIVRYFDAIVLKSNNQFGQEMEYQIGVMEYVKDGSLKEYIEQGSKDARELEQIVRGILQGLIYLHSHNIIHRDIKPPNVLLQRQGDRIIPKICDFGISKIAGSAATQLSNVIGTFEYMSPEQLGSNPGGKIATNSDLWSVGSMIYEIFTQEPPFGSRRGGTTDAKVIGRILASEPPADLGKVPQPYRKLIEVCLVRDPAQRVKSAKELLALMAPPRAARPKPKEPAPMALGASPEAPPPPPKVREPQTRPKTPPRPKTTPPLRGVSGPKSSPKPAKKGMSKDLKGALIVIAIVVLLWILAGISGGF